MSERDLVSYYQFGFGVISLVGFLLLVALLLAGGAK